jgi:hypothetical protein
MALYQGHGKTEACIVRVTLSYSKLRDPIRPDLNRQTIGVPQTCGIA